MQTLQYDTPIEVTEKQYRILMNSCSSLVAGRVDENGKYFIKAWIDVKYVQKILNEIN